jgi:hypothetical protein
MPKPTLEIEIAPLQLPTSLVGVPDGHVAIPRIEASTQVRAFAFERRNAASRRALLRRITAEFDEMPGLCLTAVQAQRLFGLREDIGIRVFSTLVDSAILRRDVNAVYRRHDGRSSTERSTHAPK